MKEEKENLQPPVCKPVPFTSKLSFPQTLAVLFYLPIHIAVLPVLLFWLMNRGMLSEAGMNLAVYGIGALYMLAAAWSFLRRDFDALCDRPLQVAAEVLGSYAVMMGCNMLFALLMSSVLMQANPNNEAITGMAVENYGPVAAMAVYLAPIVEEMMFRAGIFGTLRRYNRPAAYAVSILCFAVYHVWGFAMADPSYWIYVLQYIPVSFLLCRCYESTSSIWTSIFFHMLVNGISLRALTMLQGLV